MRRTTEEQAGLLRSARARRERMASELGELQARSTTPGTTTRISNLSAGLERHDELIAELDQEKAETESRMDRIRAAAGNPANLEAVDAPAAPRRRENGDPDDPTRQFRDAALGTIDRYVGEGALRSDAADRLDALVRGPDKKLGLDAAYIHAVGDPAYSRAFGKMIADPAMGHMRFTPDEVAAVQEVSRVESMRGLVIGTGSAGGFAVPFELDPSILLTSSGVLNPVRAISRQITVATDKWKGVSSAGVTASYDAEAAEVSDDTPTLAQPEIDCARGSAFVPFSIELGQDWATLQPELAKLISDAKDTLDATQFLTGSGTDSPAGVLTGLSTSQRIQTAGTAAFAIADVYSLKQSVPARFMPNATFAWHPNRVDSIYRFTPAGSTSEPQALPTRDGPLLGRPVVEWSTLPTATTSATKIGIYGDFHAGFTIADRIGMSVELVPHLFGGSGRPSGQRGVFAYWRTGSKVVVPEALRYLEAL